MTRRDFLQGLSAGAVASGAVGLTHPFGAAAFAAAPNSASLTLVSRTLDVNGRSARVFGLVGPHGRSGLTFNAGDRFDVALESKIDAPTLIHWHGLTPPWEQDGVPNNPAAMLEPAETRRYSFPVGKGGTHWMHAHTLQEQDLLAAPLIVRTAEDLKQDEQEVVILLHDFSFKSPEELLADLKGKEGHGGAHGGTNMSTMNHGAMKPGALGSGTMDHGTMDLNDIEYDAYLANDRTLADPEVVQVEKGGRVRLRIINGATATAFTVDTGSLDATLIAVDGQDVQPVAGRTFPVSMGQRIDLRVEVPRDGGALPVLALREGAPERTGIILASAGASVRKIDTTGAGKGPVLDLALEQRLRPVQPLAVRQADRTFALMLTGTMSGYTWNIEGAGDGLGVKQGDRVEISMHNMSMMAHPMHLHGHHFQVVDINGARFSGAVRDTVLVPPMATVTVAFDADNAGHWPLHCHHLYHMAAGMMTSVAYAR
ncbi:multicopper oxidase family protein [Methylobacterium nodulans]|uniref:Multicopper oxidase type 2 n=1 Tax=Methylobacterium nodulans (strain LMG 21967 / CNCM I-2342 / ORS 2060) TaxID=460265 RepID=B8IXS1_METNO|nr:multicopper oxidase domain-containing protein [Methylobacterium nodulans]ACL62903.1 multicopper oxidase type 2 [Methylobacterium nodulans ORS 2060]